MALLYVANPPNPWEDSTIEYLGPPPKATLKIFFDHTREIISRNDSPDVGFNYGVNPYRGCFHGCAYCYARPTHEYLGFGAGSDFERRIVVKPQAATLLEQAFMRPAWAGEVVVFSGNTDCYQPLEASYQLTRTCLQVCQRFRNPVGIITKAPLIERDIDVLQALAAYDGVRVTISIPFADPVHARAMEPTVPPPARRFQTIRALSDAGIPVGVNVAPVIPGLSDSQIVEILERAREAGALWAGTTTIRLPGPVAHVFEARLRETLPDRADRVLSLLRQMRGGQLNDARFGHRMKGQGVYADAIHTLFRTTCRRLGYRKLMSAPMNRSFRRPFAAGDQLALF